MIFTLQDSLLLGSIDFYFMPNLYWASLLNLWINSLSVLVQIKFELRLVGNVIIIIIIRNSFQPSIQFT